MTLLAPEIAAEWQGPTPWFLMILPTDGSEGIRIDLDEPNWATTNAAWMRRDNCVWTLIHKQGEFQALAVWVHPGDQPYYTARHVGLAMATSNAEIVAYGIGKKRPDGSTHRLWVLPTGIICGGDDVDDLGLRLVRQMGPK